MKHHRTFLMLFAVAAFILAGAFSAAAQVTPAQVRAAALAAGVDSLKNVVVPEPPNLPDFLKPGVKAREAAIQLGKALFWDMQVGSDGQACGTCHFHAGADSRSKNQLGPGLKNVNPALQTVFNPTGSGTAGGPNYTLTEADFPFHVVNFINPNIPERNFLNRGAPLFDTDDVVSSQGVFNANFTGITPGQSDDLGTPFADLIFNVAGTNTRRVEPRNTPTMINAVFNFANFWDGRAHNEFNGVSVTGPLDETATILVNRKKLGLVAEPVSIPMASLASQAVGPPQSDLEMSFFNRPFPEIARKLLHLRPLGLQVVDPDDSVLGRLSRAKALGKKTTATGLRTTYESLIKQAFQPEFWNSRKPTADGFTQIEKNFSLFFGLAVQMYEATLVSDATPLDAFIEGDDAALDQEQLRGLLTFINRGPGRNPIEVDDAIAAAGPIGVGNCSSCHGGPEFTDAGFTSLFDPATGEFELIEVEESPELGADGFLFVGEATVFLDNGFSNIGVRPTNDDLGRGANAAPGKPFSFVGQNLAGFPFAPDLGECSPVPDPLLPLCPVDNRAQVDGAFKIPGLRNVELTGPYFHNGGEATLSQVVEFYDRQSNFGDVNVANLDRNMAFIQLIEGDEALLVKFLLSLTDNRVRNEMAPFDHPQLFVPNGHAGDQNVLNCIEGIQACDDLLEIPGVGAGGRVAAGLPPLGTFLDLEHLEAPAAVANR